MWHARVIPCILGVFWVQIAWPVQAGAMPFAVHSDCQNQFEKTIFSLKAKNHWFKVAPKNNDVETYRTPTEYLGKWFEVDINLVNRVPNLEYSSLASTQYFLFNIADDKCVVKTHTKLKRVNLDFNDFSDESLRNLISLGRGMIYVWSPRMVYSVEHMEAFKKIAKKKRIAFTAIVEASAPQRMLASSFVLKNTHKEDRSRRNFSHELIMRESDIHYPVIFLYSFGHIHPESILGIKTEKELEGIVSKAYGNL